MNTPTRRLLAAALSALLLTLLPAQAMAQTLRVFTAGAIKPLVAAVAPGFEGRTGVKVLVQTDTAGALLRRMQAGEGFDVVVLTDAGGRQLVAAGVAARSAPVARVGIGLAVAAGAPLPPLATVDDFRAALLGARRLAYIDPQSGGSSGIYLHGLFQRLGLADAVAAKALLVPGGLTATRIADGQADMALQQTSELVGVDGVRLVGPLPAALQNRTTYAWALARSSDLADAAEVFVAALQRVAAAGALQEIGIEPLAP